MTHDRYDDEVERARRRMDKARRKNGRQPRELDGELAGLVAVTASTVVVALVEAAAKLAASAGLLALGYAALVYVGVIEP